MSRRRWAAAFTAAALLAAPVSARADYRTKRERERLDAASRGMRPDERAVFKHFLSGDYAAAAREARGRSRSPELAFVEALSLAKLGRFDEARGVLAFLAADPSPAVREPALISIADTYWSEGRWAEADRAYADAFAAFPRGDHAPYALGRLSEVAEHRHRSEDAEKFRHQLLHSFPDSRQAREASLGLGSPAGAGRIRPLAEAPSPLRQHSIEEIPLFSVQVGAFADATNAERLRAELAARHFDAYVNEDSSAPARPAGGPRFRVRVGRAERREEATELETKLKDEGYPTRICP